jgi:septal ring factor EnvC (AmiA/AmiB activator)
MELSQEVHEGRFSGYSSPWRALAWSFHKSRENWKRKYAEVKQEVKRTRDQARDLRQSRKHWKEKANALDAEKKSLEQMLAELQLQLAGQDTSAEKKGAAAI